MPGAWLRRVPPTVSGPFDRPGGSPGRPSSFHPFCYQIREGHWPQCAAAGLLRGWHRHRMSSARRYRGIGSPPE
eukprot:672455-Hanusia_phi.AAC.1